MLFQYQVDARDPNPGPGGEGFVARELDTNYNYPDEPAAGGDAK
jgi:ribonuclease HI